MSDHTPGPWVTDAAGIVFSERTRNPIQTAGLWAGGEGFANAELIAASPDLRGYVDYVEDNLERIERGGWTPICFAEFLMSQERENYA